MKAHYCPDWDYDWIEPGDPEMECCICELEVRGQPMDKQEAIRLADGLDKIANELASLKQTLIEITTDLFEVLNEPRWTDHVGEIKPKRGNQ